MSRTPPPRTPDQQRDVDRIAALKIGTPDAIRQWAARYRVPLIHPEDDELLLITIHETRIKCLTGKRVFESHCWLATNRARIIAARQGQ